VAKPIFAFGDVPTPTQVNEFFVDINFAYKTANESVTSNTTLQPDDHLTVPVLANSIYKVECMLKADGASAGALKVQWTAPASATFDWTVSAMNNGGTVFSDDQAGGFNLASSPSFGLATSGASSPVQILGLLVTAGSAGNFALTWAQFASNGTATRVLQNSFIQLTRMS
jgi:hypothetical protein